MDHALQPRVGMAADDGHAHPYAARPICCPLPSVGTYRARRVHRLQVSIIRHYAGHESPQPFAIKNLWVGLRSMAVRLTSTSGSSH